jgi:hypothetical protein
MVKAGTRHIPPLFCHRADPTVDDLDDKIRLEFLGHASTLKVGT